MSEELVTVAIATGENTAAVENVEETLEQVEEKQEVILQKVELLEEDVRRIFAELFEAKYNDIQILSDRITVLENKEAAEEKNEPGIHEPEKEPEPELETEIETSAPVKKAKKFVRGLW